MTKKKKETAEKKMHRASAPLRLMIENTSKDAEATYKPVPHAPEDFTTVADMHDWMRLAGEALMLFLSENGGRLVIIREVWKGTIELEKRFHLT